MPPVVIAIVEAAWMIANALGPVLWTALAMTVLSIGSSVVLGQISKMFSKGPNPLLNSNRIITSRQPVAPWTVAYGQNRLGGIITFLHTVGSNNETLEMVITLAGHEVNAIPNMYFDGVLVTVNGSGDAVGYWGGFAHVEYNLGTRNQAAFATLITDAPGYWTSAHRQRGRACAYVRLKWSQAKFPNGVPNITFDLNGRKVYDPRSGTIGYSTNAALCIADYLNNPDFGICAQSRYQLAAAMLANTGFNSFSASALVDGDVTTAGFSVATEPSGANIVIDLGSGNSAEFRRFRMYMSAGGNTAEYGINYSDDNVTFFAAASNFLPDVPGWNAVELAPNGAHRYWSLTLNAAATGSGFANEIDFWTSDVDTTQLVAAANSCDEEVAVASGTIKTYVAATISASTLNQAVTPASMTGILAGMTLSVDVGVQQENVLVVAVTGTTFTAVFLKAHGRPTPGWLVTAYGAAYGATIPASITGSGTAQVVTVDAMGNIAVGAVLCIDQGNPNQEFVTVTATTDTTFTAIFLLNHTGPVSVFQTESRFTVNGSFTVDHMPSEIIGRMNSAMAGSVAYLGGKWGIFPGVWRAPTISLIDSDFRGPMTVQTRLTHRDLYNGVKGTFISPVNNWQASDYPPFQSASALLEDNNEQLWLDVELPFTITSASAQRLSSIALNRVRKQITVQGQFKLTAYQVQPLDVVQLSHPRFGWTNKTFEVQSCTLAYAPDSGSGTAGSAGIALGVDLTLRETDSTVYNWSPADEIPLQLAPATVMPRNTICAPPTNLIVSPIEIIRNVDGIRQSFISVSWTAPADQFVIDGGLIIVQYKKHTDTLWLQAGTVDGSVTTANVGPVVDGTLYDIQIWAENSSGVSSSTVSASATPTGTSVTLDTIGDGATFVRLLHVATDNTLHASTSLNFQGNIPAKMMNSGNVAFAYKSPADSNVQFSWPAFAVTRGDGSTLNIGANTVQPVPSAPTVSQVSGGTLAAATLFFRVALVKDGVIMSVSGETSFTKSANNFFSVASPASQSGYDGWVPLIGGSTGLAGLMSYNVSGTLVVPIAFGTNYTESQASPFSGAGTGDSISNLTTPPSPAGSGTLTTPINLLVAPNTQYFVYFFWDAALGMVRLSWSGTAKSIASAALQSGDGKVALSDGAISFTTPATGGSGSGSGGSGGGGKGSL